MAVYPSMHLGVGAAMASAAMNMLMILSFGMFTYLSWFDTEEPEPEDPMDAAPERPYPAPDFLVAASYRSSINVACIGHARSGKSSLVNALRGRKPGEAEAAPVGLEHATRKPVAYELGPGGAQPSTPRAAAAEKAAAGGRSVAVAGCAAWETDVPRREPTHIRIWDMPAIEAGRHAWEGWCRELGLAYFDAVLIVYSQHLQL